MRATHVGILLFQFLALSDGQCACRTTTPPQNATTAVPETNVSTTTMAAMAANATTTMGVANTTTTAAPTTAAPTNATTAAPTTLPDDAPTSSGPSSGPARLLMDISDVDYVDRQLQEDNVSDGTSNVTTSQPTSMSTSPTEVSAAEECECPLPEVVSTFTASLSLSSVADLAGLDFEDIKTELAADQGWGDSVVMVPVVEIGIQYTLDVDITEAQCKAAVAAAYDVTEDDVECGDASSAPAPSPDSAPAPAPDSAPAPAPESAPAPAPASRRLQTVKDVTISFTDVQAATAAATNSQNTTDFTTALADAGVEAVVAVGEADVCVKLTFTVTADVAIDEPTPASLVSAVTAATGGAITVEAEITGFATTFTRMPCSQSDVCDAGGWEQAADSDEIGCDGESCTAEERDRCCVRVAPTSTGSAQGTCVLGSLFSMALWNLF